MTRALPRPTATLSLLLLAGVATALAACSDSSGPPARQAAVTPVDPATAGTIEVQVAYTGSVPPPKEVNMRGTAACAAMHPEPVYDTPLAVTNGKLANAVVYIKSGFGDRAFAPPSQPVVIDQKGCLYTPRTVAVMVGQPLQFRNSDREAHNVHGRPQEVKAWNFLMSRPNSTRDLIFDRPEVGIAVGCDVHPWMRAYVSVIDNPYFGVTGTDGTVTLQNVPPGDYVVAAWHEKLGSVTKQVVLPASGRARVDLSYAAESAG